MDLSKIRDKLKTSPKLVIYLIATLICIVLLLLMNSQSESKAVSDDVSATVSAR